MNNTTLNPGNGGDTIGTIDLVAFGGYPLSIGKLPAGVIYVGPDLNTKPAPLTNANPLPCVLQAGANLIGSVSQSGTWVVVGSVTIGAALPAGANVIGGVTQSGTWNVTVNTALPAGANVIGGVTQSGTWNVTVNTALPAGANVIGGVTQSGTWNVTVSNATIAVTQSGTWNVTVNTALPAGANTIGAVTQASGPWTENLTQLGGTAIDTNSGTKSAGTQRVVLATDQPALTNAQPVNVAQINGTTTHTTTAGVQDVNLLPATSGGFTSFRYIWPNSSAGVSAKGSGGQIYGWSIYNAAAATRYIKFYNKATAPNTGTDTPQITLGIPANSLSSVEFPHGLAGFSLGIGFAGTTGIGDSDTGAPTANDMVMNLFFM